MNSNNHFIHSLSRNTVFTTFYPLLNMHNKTVLPKMAKFYPTPGHLPGEQYLPHPNVYNCLLVYKVLLNWKEECVNIIYKKENLSLPY